MICHCPHCQCRADCTGLSGTVVCPTCQRRFKVPSNGFASVRVAPPPLSATDATIPPVTVNSALSFSTSRASSRGATKGTPDRSVVRSHWLWSLFGGWLASNLVAPASLGLLLVAENNAEGDFWMGVGLLLALAFSGVAAIAYLTWLWLCWGLIQDGKARTTPGKAVGFLFIPLYNLFWNFTALEGLSADLNGYAARWQIRAPRANSSLAYLACLCAVCSLIPFVGMLASLVNLVAMPLAVYSITASAAAISDARARGAFKRPADKRSSGFDFLATGVGAPFAPAPSPPVPTVVHQLVVCPHCRGQLTNTSAVQCQTVSCPVCNGMLCMPPLVTS